MRKLKVFVGRSVKVSGKSYLKLGNFSTLDNYSNIQAYSSEGVLCGDRFKLGAYSIISCTSHLSKLGKGVTIGDDVGISEFCFLGASGGITIGNNVIMGQYVSFHSQNHIFEDSSQPIQHQGTSSEGITIGDGTWIGAKVTLLDGVKVGKNCVIAAGAVVKNSFPDNCLIGGVPAKLIKDLSTQ